MTNMKLCSLVITLLILIASNWLVLGKSIPTTTTKNLFLECSCLQAQDHNGTSKMPTVVNVNASMARHAKNDCYIIFITGTSEEIVSLRFQNLQLRPNCLDYIEIFPYLREAVVENTTQPEYIICNYSSTSLTTASNASSHEPTMSTNITPTNNTATSLQTTMSSPPPRIESNIGHLPNVTSFGNISTTTLMNSHDLSSHQFIYSSGKVFALRLRFSNKPLPPPLRPPLSTTSPTSAAAAGKEAKAALQQKIDNWNLNVTVEYRFLKKERFKNDGRLIPGTFCDYYFFANPDVSPKSLEIWKYFHSPRFPAKYPAHIKCSYKFIGRPETRVELIFEELEIPKDGESCNLDKLTIFDAESLNMNAVIDVLCGNSSSGVRHILSTGPDLLIEFNASSNVTAKGFRGKFKFIQNNEIMEMKKSNKATDIPFVADMYSNGGGDVAGGVGVAIGGGAGTIIGNSLDEITIEDNIIRSSGIAARKQNLMAFNTMDNTKVFKGSTKEDKCVYVVYLSLKYIVNCV
ncbi:sol1 isoform X2 [Musca autumnalis]|uniref:sol1 isoform X2 n=1 Tax=Musca autumnalis TaxID=221902 RepID=UPI003CF2B677